MTREIDLWAEQNDCARSEAIRRLVELGLTVKPAAISKRAARRARELAEETFDRSIPRQTTPAEAAVRKRRLVEGPSDFVNVRKDRPK